MDNTFNNYKNFSTYDNYTESDENHGIYCENCHIATGDCECPKDSCDICEDSRDDTTCGHSKVVRVSSDVPDYFECLKCGKQMSESEVVEREEEQLKIKTCSHLELEKLIDHYGNEEMRCKACHVTESDLPLKI
jgi:hypothetical protein